MLPYVVIVIEPLWREVNPVVLVQMYCVVVEPTMRGDWKAKLWLDPTLHENITGSWVLV